LAASLLLLPLSGCMSFRVGQSPSDYLVEHEKDYWALVNLPQEMKEGNSVIVGLWPGALFYSYDPDAGRRFGSQSGCVFLSTLWNVVTFGAWIPIGLIFSSADSYDSSVNDKSVVTYLTLLGFVKHQTGLIDPAEFGALKAAEKAVFEPFVLERPPQDYAKQLAERSGVGWQEACAYTSRAYGGKAFLTEAQALFNAANELHDQGKQAFQVVLIGDGSKASIDFRGLPVADRKYAEATALLETFEAKWPGFHASPDFPLLPLYRLRGRLHLVRAQQCALAQGFASEVANLGADAAAIAQTDSEVAHYEAIVRMADKLRPRLQGKRPEEDQQVVLDLVELEGSAHAGLARALLRKRDYMQADQHRKRVIELLPAIHPTVLELERIFAAESRGS
jgi:tetratricopeptide (TPR) repeat protein